MCSLPCVACKQPFLQPSPEQFVSDVYSNTEKSAPQISADALNCLGTDVSCSVSHQCFFLFSYWIHVGFSKHPMFFLGHCSNTSGFPGSPQALCLPRLTNFAPLAFCAMVSTGAWMWRKAGGASTDTGEHLPGGLLLLKIPALSETHPLQQGSDSTCEQEPCHSNRWAPVQTAKKTCIFIKKKNRKKIGKKKKKGY